MLDIYCMIITIMMDILRIAQRKSLQTSSLNQAHESGAEKTLIGVVAFALAQIIKRRVVDPLVEQLAAERAMAEQQSLSRNVKHQAAETVGRALANEAVVVTLSGALYEAGKLLVSAIERRASEAEQIPESALEVPDAQSSASPEA